METQAITKKKTIYTGSTRTTGGRDGGAARSNDGNLDIKLSVPGSTGSGTNPEQLFAAGWSACFIGAMKKAASEINVQLPADTAVEADVELMLGDDGYSLNARLTVTLPGLDALLGRQIADRAHQICPYSKATRGNIDVEIRLK